MGRYRILQNDDDVDENSSCCYNNNNNGEGLDEKDNENYYNEYHHCNVQQQQQQPVVATTTTTTTTDCNGISSYQIIPSISSSLSSSSWYHHNQYHPKTENKENDIANNNNNRNHLYNNSHNDDDNRILYQHQQQQQQLQQQQQHNNNNTIHDEAAVYNSTNRFQLYNNNSNELYNTDDYYYNQIGGNISISSRRYSCSWSYSVLLFSIGIVLVAYFLQYDHHSVLLSSSSSSSSSIIPPGPPPPIQWLSSVLYTSTTTSTATSSRETTTRNLYQYTNQYGNSKNYDDNDDSDYSNDDPFIVSKASATTTIANTSWRVYIHTHLYQLLHSMIVLFIQIPYYVIQYMIYNCYDEIRNYNYYNNQYYFYYWLQTQYYYYHSTFNQLIKYYFYNEHNDTTINSTTTSDINICHHHCYNNIIDQWVVPPVTHYSSSSGATSSTIMEKNDHSSSIYDHDGTYYVIGQEIVKEYIHNAVYTWQQQQIQQPFIVVATGYQYTGKRQLAYNIIQSWRLNRLDECIIENHNNFRRTATTTLNNNNNRKNNKSTDHNRLLLEINGKDWQLQDYEKDDDVDPIIDDDDNIKKTMKKGPNRYQRMLYRKFIHFIESHYYRYIHHRDTKRNSQSSYVHMYNNDCNTLSSLKNVNNQQQQHVQLLQQPHLILITNIEDMEPYVLIQFLLQMQSIGNINIDYINDFIETNYNDNDIDVESTNNNEKNLIQLDQLCSNTIIYLTTNQYGVSSIIRHVRQSWLYSSNNNNHQDNALMSPDKLTTSSIPLPTTTTIMNNIGLISDIRDAIKKEFQKIDIGSTSSRIEGLWDKITILPFIPITSTSLRTLLRYRIHEYYETTIRTLNVTSTNITSIIITDNAVDAILNDKYIEYIEWRRKTKKNNNDDTDVTDSTTSLPPTPTTGPSFNVIQKIVVDGTNAIRNTNPIMTKLYTEIHQAIVVIEQQQPTSNHHHDNKLPSSSSFVLLLDYDPTTIISLYDRGAIQLCDGGDNYLNTGKIKSVEYNSKSNCRTLRRFHL